jgi:signal peptidase I
MGAFMAGREEIHDTPLGGEHSSFSGDSPLGSRRMDSVLSSMPEQVESPHRPSEPASDNVAVTREWTASSGNASMTAVEDRASGVTADHGASVADEAVNLAQLWQEAKAFLRDLAFAVVVAVLVIGFVVQPVRVEGTSMVPRLHDGERIFVNKFIYRFERIERGDIVVFWYPNDPSKSFIKRVIGLPGETISIREGVVYVDGVPLDESYIDPAFHIRRENMAPVYVRDHYYFVMGDNRDSSNDSRQWGLVPEKYIYGKAIFRYWPLSSFGAIK